MLGFLCLGLFFFHMYVNDVLMDVFFTSNKFNETEVNGLFV